MAPAIKRDVWWETKRPVHQFSHKGGSGRKHIRARRWVRYWLLYRPSVCVRHGAVSCFCGYFTTSRCSPGYADFRFDSSFSNLENIAVKERKSECQNCCSDSSLISSRFLESKRCVLQISKMFSNVNARKNFQSTKEGSKDHKRKQKRKSKQCRNHISRQQKILHQSEYMRWCSRLVNLWWKLNLNLCSSSSNVVLVILYVERVLGVQMTSPVASANIYGHM